MTRSTRFFLVFVLILIAGTVGIAILANRPTQVSEEFNSSKKQALLMAQELIDISNNSIKNVEQISVLNNEKKFAQSRDLIQQEFDKNELIKEKAIKLSDDLAKMAKNALEIRSERSMQLILEAVSVETELLTHLISYNNDLNELLGILELQLNGEQIVMSDVSELTQRINSKVKAITELDAKFDGLMEEFEKSLE